MEMKKLLQHEVSICPNVCTEILSNLQVTSLTAPCAMYFVQCSLAQLVLPPLALLPEKMQKICISTVNSLQALQEHTMKLD